MKSYGQDFEVRKLECVGHIKKEWALGLGNLK